MKNKEKRESKGVYVVFALVLALCVGLIAVRVHNEKRELPVEQATPAPENSNENAQLPLENEAAENADASESEADVEVGTLIESGNKIDENFFAYGEYYGTASDLSETSFYMGKAGMAFDADTHPLMSPIEICFSENTEIRRAVLYYNDDKYEVYASDISEFEVKMNERGFIDSVLVSAADTNGEKIYADVVTFYEFADLG